MASIINFPFNHNPTSIDDKTSSYTVPSTSYARVTFLAGDCTFDSKDVFSRESYTYSLSTATNYHFSVLNKWDYYTFTRSSSATGSFYACSLDHGAATVSVSAAIATGQTTYGLFGRDLDDIGIASTTTFPTGHRIIRLVASLANENWTITVSRAPYPITLWVPPSTDLDGSFYHVELYTAPT